MPRDIDRWSDNWYDNSGPTNYSMEYIRSLTEDYVVNYPAFIYSEIRDTLNTDTLQVTLAQTTNGSVKLNSINPNTKTGSWTGIYFENTAITLSAKPEPGFQLTSWIVNGENAGSGNEINLELTDNPYVIEPTFEAVSNDEIVINEINYNSSDDFDAGDWIELYNFSDSEIDLSGWVFRDDDDEHTFILPDATTIQSGGYVVLANDTTAFKTVHPGISFVKGEVDFGLGGGGDQVRIFNENEVLIDFVEYANTAPWPTTADGEGYTLELQSHESDNALAESWMASEEIGGTPGSSNISTSSENETETPQIFALNQNYPNPFNPSTSISFVLPQAEKLNLKVFNILGQEVHTIVDRQMTAGQHVLSFDASNLPSGVYIYRFKSNSFSDTKKMILLK
ncbi:lamin tail domain-containing protein [Gracilimonas sp.]|uniref:lamin tail domain-containing protein n=1 Tax=Gracilimonas sp. TaxID=1974203 RepID=UPI002871E997|nr:lamin tail domain-containing protein [Gracilimonas sp.]